MSNDDFSQWFTFSPQACSTPGLQTQPGDDGNHPSPYHIPTPAPQTFLAPSPIPWHMRTPQPPAQFVHQQQAPSVFGQDFVHSQAQASPTPNMFEGIPMTPNGYNFEFAGSPGMTPGTYDAWTSIMNAPDVPQAQGYQIDGPFSSQASGSGGATIIPETQGTASQDDSDSGSDSSGGATPYVPPVEDEEDDSETEGAPTPQPGPKSKAKRRVPVVEISGRQPGAYLPARPGFAPHADLSVDHDPGVDVNTDVGPWVIRESPHWRKVDGDWTCQWSFWHQTMGKRAMREAMRFHQGVVTEMAFRVLRKRYIQQVKLTLVSGGSGPLHLRPDILARWKDALDRGNIV